MNEGFDKFIVEVQENIAKNCPNQLPYFEIYASEARFNLNLIHDDIIQLGSSAKILEVGAGLLLTSGYLAKIGFDVDALEPLSSGYSHFGILQQAVLGYYRDSGLKLNLISQKIELFKPRNVYDFCFSVNVFEHIENINVGILNSVNSLKKNAWMHVYCPNYTFPYEPHFDIPIILNKKITGAIFQNKIFKSTRVPEAIETWQGLNWISHGRINRIIDNIDAIEIRYNKFASYEIAMRIFEDKNFRERRSRFFIILFDLARKTGCLALVKWMPVSLAPVLDFKIYKN